MINLIVTSLCALTALLCAVLSFKGYYRNHYKLLFWSGLCFTSLTLSNLAMIIDLYIYPDLNLVLVRLCLGLVATLVLIYGLIFNE